MSPAAAEPGERFEVAYLVLSGTTTAARCPELLRGLGGLGFATIIVLPTPNASRVIAPRELADVAGVRVVDARAVEVVFAVLAGDPVTIRAAPRVGRDALLLDVRPLPAVEPRGLLDQRPKSLLLGRIAGHIEAVQVERRRDVVDVDAGGI